MAGHGGGWGGAYGRYGLPVISTPPAELSPSTLRPAEPRAPEQALGPQVQLQQIWHRYGNTDSGSWTLQGIDLDLHQGELVGLLGPSGCGKTTLLRLIAGFERPARGRVCIHGREVAGPQRWLEPERRGVGMVFQDYALFPHLTAWANACFGFRRGADTARATWLLALLGLKGLEQRYPHELSGGQRQRLALARALAPGPAVVLLDEPFSNLDVEVRLRLRSELPGVLSECGACGLIVTHDPEEALAICDRVAVLDQGTLHQIASPQELVQHPASAFVGRFVLQDNLLPIEALSGSRLHTAIGVWSCGSQPLQSSGGAAAETLQLLVSPEALTLAADPDGDALVLGREFLGRQWLVLVQRGGLRLRLRLPLDQEWQRGQRCRVSPKPGAQARLYPGAVTVTAL